MESRKPKRPSEVHIKAATNKGYIVRHSFDNYGAGESFQPAKEYAIGSHHALMKHISEHLGPDSGAYDGKPDVKGDDDGDMAGERVATKPVPRKSEAPSRRTYGAGVD